MGQVDQDSRTPVADTLGAGPSGLLLAPVAPTPGPAAVRIPRIHTLTAADLDIRSVTQTKEGDWYRLRGSAAVETVEMLLRADEIDYNEVTGEAIGRGNVRYESFERAEEIEADRVEYNLKSESGKFYGVRGTAPAAIDYRPGLLRSNNPFVFQGEWAERLNNRYILYNGFITNCRLPRPWWILKGPKFDIIPGDRAIAYKAQFKVRRVPIFYFPAFYKALDERPRKSGFLMPSIGNSSRRGKMVGGGYYWAMNRSYDLTYRGQYFTQRGFAHHVDFRGKPTQTSDFNTIVYGVNDKGLEQPDGSRVKQGGYLITFQGKTKLPKGFYGRADINYLSSFVFRQAFTESFNEAVFSEVTSTGFARKDWSTYSLSLVGQRIDNYLSSSDDDRISIHKLPSVEFLSRDRQINDKFLPLWFSFESSAALMRRNQPVFQTRQRVDRIDVVPRVMTALRWRDFHLLPYASARETHYGSSLQEGLLSGEGIWRNMQEAGAELRLPSLARIYDGPKWLGEKVKHVIEPRAGYRYARGIDNFSDIIRFDDLELYSNTKELDYSVTQRWFAKKGAQVTEVVSWQLWQKRFFDPTFGGALGTGRNVLQTSAEMTAFAFLDGPRKFSPVVSVVNVNPSGNLGVEWRSDYDPERHRVTNSSLLANFRQPKYFLSLGHNQVRSVSQLSPAANQFIGLLAVGRSDQRGWSAGFSAVYDFRINAMQFATTQVSYNSDCCGLSFQYRRFDFGTRNENQFRVAFAVANIGSFGTLRRQERVF